MKKLLISLSVLAVAASCNTNDEGSVMPTEGAKMTLNVSTALSTKVDVAEYGSSWSVKWSDGDDLAAWSDSGFEKFTMSTFGEEESKFEGTAPADATMRLVYPYTESLTLSLDNQTVATGFDHLGATTYMVSETIDTSDTAQSVQMTHIGAAIELRMKFSDSTVADGYTLSALTIGTTGGVSLPLTGSLDIDSGEFTTSTTGAMSLTANLAAESGIYYARFSTFPFDIEADEELNIIATFSNGDDEFSAQGSVVNSTDSTVSIARATKNTLYAVLEENLIANPGFEESLDSWTNSGSTAVIESTNVITGEHSVRFTTTNSYTGWVRQVVTVEPGATYKMGFTGRAQASAGAAGSSDAKGYLRMQLGLSADLTDLSSTFTQLANLETAQIEANVNTKVEVEITIPDDYGPDVVINIFKTAGICYVDDTYLIKISE